VFGRNHYWGSLLAVTGISWFWLALATWRLSSSWRDRAMGPRVLARFELLREFRQRGQAGRAALRKRLLEINPFFWLGGPGQVSAPVFMLLTVILVIFTSFFAAPFFGRVLRAGKFSPMIGSLLAWFLAGLAIHAVLLYYAAMAASRRLAEDKQSGALELVLSTPTSERSISRGLWMAYGRKMFFPATMALLITLFVVWQGGAMAVLEPPALKIPPGTTASQLLWHGLLDRPIGGVRLEWPFVLMLRMVVLAFAMFVLIWLTLGCVGPWLGLRMKHPGFAPLASLALVLVPPTILFSVACFIADEINLDRLPQRLFVPIMIWVAFGIGVVHCLLLSFWTARRLRKDFRTIVTSRFQPPPLRPWWRPTRRTVVRFGFGGLAASTVLLILVAAFYGYQNWQSRKAWSSFQDQLKQRNESLDLAVLLPAPAAENQNFARTPAYQGWVDPQARDASTRTLFDNLKQFEVQTAHPAISTLGLDWTHQGLAPLDKHLGWLGAQGVFSGKPTSADLATFLLQALERHKEPMRALADAARLPYFQPLTNRSARAVLVPARRDNGALERLHMLFQVRACALLATDRNTEAGEDVLASLELVRLARQIPDAQSSMRTQILLMRSLQPHWEGIVQHGWSGSQLAGFQSELSRINLLVDYTNAVYRVVLANIEQWQRFADRKSPRVQQPEGWEHLDNPVWQMQPRSWWLDNCAQLYQAGKAAIENVDVAGAHVYLGGRMSDLNGLPVGDQTTFLFQQPYWPGAYPGNVVFAQTALNQAIIACALERFRLAQGKYPELLQELVPEYLSTIPNDVVRGRPMLYENPNDGSFVLRSVGPNQSEDRNKPGSDDWLWSFPTNAPSAVVR
jgi:hypothetical protein